MRGEIVMDAKVFRWATGVLFDRLGSGGVTALRIKKLAEVHRRLSASVLKDVKIYRAATKGGINGIVLGRFGGKAERIGTEEGPAGVFGLWAVWGPRDSAKPRKEQ